MAIFAAVAPVFLVAEIGVTAHWYQEMLGFVPLSVPGRGPREWVSLGRDAVQIMLQRSPGYVRPDLQAHRPGGVWDAYLRICGLGELYRELGRKDAVRSKLRHRGQGLFEFAVRDPNNYLLVLAEAVDPER